MILWLTGNSGSGKTTLARSLADKNTVILDGDITRTIWPGLTMSKEDRWTQGLRNARLAAMLENQGFVVIVSIIAPYADLRKEITNICGCKWIYLPGGKEGAHYPYEIPSDPEIKVCYDSLR
jgi:adenylylsulfate kinase-like enzyme